MADGFTIELDPDLAARLKARAEELGVTPAGYAIDAVEHYLHGADWGEDLAALEEYDREGGGVDAEAALAEFRAELERKLAERAAAQTDVSVPPPPVPD
jgi:predicted transcriptional regulator